MDKGTHILADFYGVRETIDGEDLKILFQEAAEVCGETVITTCVHTFSPNGVSGVGILAGSHISVYTFPEHQFAAVDVYMCGDACPGDALEVIRQAYNPETVISHEKKRGVLE